LEIEVVSIYEIINNSKVAFLICENLIEEICCPYDFFKNVTKCKESFRYEIVKNKSVESFLYLFYLADCL